jgi:Ca2+-transporting ATPase
MEKYVPISGEMRNYIFDTISGVVKARGQAGMVAFLMLLWVAIQFLATLVQATNRAWNIEGDKWWRLPFKSMSLLLAMVAAVFIGMGVPVLIKTANRFLPAIGFFSWADNLSAFLLPWLVFFFCMSLFYQMAPRRRTHFSEVWFSALCATALLQAAQHLFIIYLRDFAVLNAVYGTFGGIMALLLWIYLSGCIFIFGACLCAAQAETREPAAG